MQWSNFTNWTRVGAFDPIHWIDQRPLQRCCCKKQHFITDDLKWTPNLSLYGTSVRPEWNICKTFETFHAPPPLDFCGSINPISTIRGSRLCPPHYYLPPPPHPWFSDLPTARDLYPEWNIYKTFCYIPNSQRGGWAFLFCSGPFCSKSFFVLQKKKLYQMKLCEKGYQNLKRNSFFVILSKKGT